MGGFISYKQYVLNETYESQEELKQYVKDLVALGNKLPFKKFLTISKLIDTDKFKVIGDFLKNTSLGLVIAPELKELPQFANVGGIYLRPYEYGALPIDKDIIASLKNTFKNLIVIINPNGNVLLHELQHAYDDYRSKGKFISQKTEDQLATAQKKQDTTKYFRSVHELSAYYTQIVAELQFVNEYQQLRDFKSIYYEFKEMWPQYDKLTPKIKKVLVRKLSSYYEKLKEERQKGNMEVPPVPPLVSKKKE